MHFLRVSIQNICKLSLNKTSTKNKPVRNVKTFFFFYKIETLKLENHINDPRPHDLPKT